MQTLNLQAAALLSENEALLLLSCDPHMSEYIPQAYKDRAKISGFKGSAGSLIISAKAARLITDGRYAIAAKTQANKGIDIRISSKSFDEIVQFLLENDIKNVYVRFDAISTSWANNLISQGFKLLEAKSLLERVYQETLPECEFGQIYAQLKQFALINTTKLIEQLRLFLDNLTKSEANIKASGDMTEAIAAYSNKALEGDANSDLPAVDDDYLLICALDDIAHLLNLRGSDVRSNPVFYSYFLLSRRQIYLFANDNFTPDAKTLLNNLGIKVLSYKQTGQILSRINGKIFVDFNSLNYAIASCLKQPYNAVLPAFKEIKTSEQIAAICQAHKIDAAILLGFYASLHEQIANGQKLREKDLIAMLLEHRKSSPYYMGESFAPIVAAGANAALPHYDGSQNSLIDGLLLIDCGAQYQCGTTDITRVHCFGPISDELKFAYTQVLKAHINLASAKLAKGVSMLACDALARAPLWAVGADYAHGTGHGVGYFGCVHEGSRAFNMSNTKELVAGWVGSIEPGWYEEGKWGIRLEGLVATIASDDGKWLSFLQLSLYPFEASLIDFSLLTTAQLQWLKDFHQTILKEILPLLHNDNHREFLQNKCAPFLKCVL